MSNEVDQYVAELRRVLHDQPRSRKRELLADATEHLRELDAGAVATLGPPHEWAAEYRNAVGVAPRTRRQRWRALPWWAHALSPVAAAGLILGVVVVAWWPHYQPLEAHVLDSAVAGTDTVDERLVTVVPYRDGATVGFTVLLDNQGIVPVRVRPRDVQTGDVMVPISMVDMTGWCCDQVPPHVDGGIEVPRASKVTLSITYAPAAVRVLPRRQRKRAPASPAPSRRRGRRPSDLRAARQ